jgi:hypothetical protein
MQTKSMSMIEAITNTLVGFVMSILLQLMMTSALSIQMSLDQNLIMSLVFTVASVARGYLVRRMFLKLHDIF